MMPLNVLFVSTEPLLLIIWQQNIADMHFFCIFAHRHSNKKNMRNKSPERFSFHELKSIINIIKTKGDPVKFIGKELAMLGEGHKALQNILQPDTPYIMEDCRMGFVRKGRISLTVNLIEREYGEGTFAFIPAGSILQINGMSEDFDLCGMMISDVRLKAAMGNAIPAWCNGNGAFFTVHPSDEDASTIRQIFNTIWLLISKERFPDETLNGLIHGLIHYYNYLKDVESDTAQPETSRGKELFNMFISLVNINAKHERKLQFYADKMCVTPRYLSSVVKQTSGITAKEWIDRAVVTNAKVMLKYGSRQVAEVAYALNFPNVSFFCKYFKHLTGQTPQEYRIK